MVVAEADLRSWARTNHLSPRQAFEAALEKGIFPECFERNFPSLMAAEQLKLFKNSALVVGLGGLGGTLAVLLARLGVGRLLLADGDVFAPSNLNRQWLATQSTLGEHKAQVAARRIHDINAALSVEAVPHYLNRDNLASYLAQVQVALDGLDSLKARRELFAAAQEARVPLVHGAVVGVFGQVSTILPDDGDAFARIYAAASLEAEGPREILAPTASLIASLQVQEAIRLLLAKPPAYHQKLGYFDGDTGRLEILPLG